MIVTTVKPLGRALESALLNSSLTTRLKKESMRRSNELGKEKQIFENILKVDVLRVIQVLQTHNFLKTSKNNIHNERLICRADKYQNCS